MAIDVKSEILSAIAKADDQNMKTLLLLMLGVLEEIGGKIDAIWKNDKALREAVLNGHEAVHGRHHEWIEQRMESKCAAACQWAEKKMVEEIEATKTAKEDARADKRVARDAVIRQVVTIFVSVAAGVVGALWALK